MASRPLTFGEIFQEVQEAFPNAAFNTCRRYLNNEMISLATRFKMKAKDAYISSVSGKMWYDLSDVGTDLGVSKVWRVSLLNSDDKYELIRRLVHAKSIKLWDAI